MSIAEYPDSNAINDARDEESQLRELILEICVRDRETLNELLQREPGDDRDEYALAALRLGVLALRTARGQLDANVIQRETEHLLGSLQNELGNHGKTVREIVAGSLDQYFNPQSGRFHERVERLVKQDGELEQVLRRQIGGVDSELVRTLTTHLGESSPLLKALAPDESNQLIRSLRETIEKQLTSQRDHVLKEFSLDNKDGSLSKLVREILESHGKVNLDLKQQIDGVVKQFSLDQEDSALSNLVRNVDYARKAITDEFSLDNDRSAFSRLKIMLSETQSVVHQSLTLDDENSALSRLRKQMFELLESQLKSNTVFQEEVKTSIATLIAKRQEADRSVRHGLVFEAAVGEFLQMQAQRKGDLCQSVGNTPGTLKRKTGDFVLELGPESAAPGSRIAIEAKEDSSYNLKRACEECDEARKNRDAECSLFVWSKRTAPEGTAPLGRYGQDVLVLWDAEDSATDVYFQAGLELVRALALRKQQSRTAAAADFAALDKAINEIEKRAAMLEDMSNWANNIKRDGGKIFDGVQKLKESLEKQIQVLRERSGDLQAAIGGETNSVA